MSHDKRFSDEQLNALIDNELNVEEQNEVQLAISNDPALQAKYAALCRTKELIMQAYAEVPQPIVNIQNRMPWLNRPLLASSFLAIAASVFLLLWVYKGSLLDTFLPHENSPYIKTAAEFNASKPQSETILFHISTTDANRVNAVLQKAELLLETARRENTPLQLEIVANVEGLNILRKGSPYANEISALSNQFANVKFLACGIAKKTAELKEGKPIELLPEAIDIPAALDQILNRLKDGWTYVKG